MKKVFLLMMIVLLVSAKCFGAEYVVQFDSDNALIKAYTVTEQCPIRESVPAGRTQLVLTSKEDFDELEAVYTKDGRNAKYTYDTETREISIVAVDSKDNSKIIVPIQAEL